MSGVAEELHHRCNEVKYQRVTGWSYNGVTMELQFKPLVVLSWIVEGTENRLLVVVMIEFCVTIAEKKDDVGTEVLTIDLTAVELAPSN